MSIKKINIIQFAPYYPPHVWWLENVVQGIDMNWKHGESIVFSWDMWQIESDKKGNNIFFPSYEIIPNFPVPMFWKKDFWRTYKQLKDKITEEEEFVVLTHTRFFLSSFLWGIFARKNKLKCIHVEHGSEYVKLGSKFKSYIAYVYDKTLGRWVLRKSDKVLTISQAAANFVREFDDIDVSTWYRGIDIPEVFVRKWTNIDIVFIWRLVHLKGVKNLLQAYSDSWLDNKMILFWDGDEKKYLKQLSIELWISKNIIFKWYTQAHEVISYLQHNRCLLVNPSYQEGMPTTVIEALATKNVVVASDVGGTSEISDKSDLILCEAWNIIELTQKLKLGIDRYFDVSGKSYELIQGRFSWENNVEKLYNFIIT